jgi:hypothetical protein
MSILAQSGWGRSDKLEKGLDFNVIDGVIMSPRDERKDRLEKSIVQLRKDYPNSKILFDPQFYATTLSSPRDGYLEEFDYYKQNTGLRRTHFAPSDIQKYVKQCMDYQFNTFSNDLSYIISPTILFDDFSDAWSQISINLAVESKKYYSKLSSPPPLLISIAFSENALNSLSSIEDFLDSITELEDIEGFYIIVRRNSSTLQHTMDNLSHLMYFCYVLAELNQYHIIVGYSDLISFILHSSGVKSTACGWYQNLRQFSMSRFLPTTGGHRPIKRYSSTRLLSILKINPELEEIFKVGLLDQVLSNTENDDILLTGPALGYENWTDEMSCLNHWGSLTSLLRRISASSSIKEKLDTAQEIIQKALNLYTQLNHAGINLEPTTGPNHLDSWLDSIKDFRTIVNI